MTITRARVILAAVFLSGLLIQLLLVSASSRAISGKDTETLIIKVLSIYSIQLAVILGSVFAEQAGRSNTSFSVSSFWIALVLAAIWNVLLIGRTVVFARAAFNPTIDDSVNSIMSYLENISGASTFLVAGSLAFFFKKE